MLKRLRCVHYRTYISPWRAPLALLATPQARLAPKRAPLWLWLYSNLFSWSMRQCSRTRQSHSQGMGGWAQSAPAAGTPAAALPPLCAPGPAPCSHCSRALSTIAGTQSPPIGDDGEPHGLQGLLQQSPLHAEPCNVTPLLEEPGPSMLGHDAGPCKLGEASLEPSPDQLLSGQYFHAHSGEREKLPDAGAPLIFSI